MSSCFNRRKGRYRSVKDMLKSTYNRERNCRFCNNSLKYTFTDLGMSPIANDYLSEAQIHLPEKFYPLHTYICENCLLVQLEEFESPDCIFGDGDRETKHKLLTFLLTAKANSKLIVG